MLPTYKSSSKSSSEEYNSEIQQEVKDKIYQNFNGKDNFETYNKVQSYFNKYFYKMKLLDE